MAQKVRVLALSYLAAMMALLPVGGSAFYEEKFPYEEIFGRGGDIRKLLDNNFPKHSESSDVGFSKLYGEPLHYTEKYYVINKDRLAYDRGYSYGHPKPGTPPPPKHLKYFSEFAKQYGYDRYNVPGYRPSSRRSDRVYKPAPHDVAKFSGYSLRDKHAEFGVKDLDDVERYVNSFFEKR